MTWNAGGLHSSRYQELCQWLKMRDKVGAAPDLIFIQETSWKECFEYTTAGDHESEPQWHAVHSGSSSTTGGLLCLISAKLFRTEQIRVTDLHPGRLKHIRLMCEPAVDFLHVYQHAWTAPKSSGNSVKTWDQLLQQRKHIWRQVGQWCRSIPVRNGSFIIGDMNTPVFPYQGIYGQGIAKPEQEQCAQLDYGEFQDILTHFGYVTLNTWSKAGRHARTFLPAGYHHDEAGTQTDFVCAFMKPADGKSRRATPVLLPYHTLADNAYRTLRMSPFQRSPRQRMRTDVRLYKIAVTNYNMKNTNSSSRRSYNSS